MGLGKEASAQGRGNPFLAGRGSHRLEASVSMGTTRKCWLLYHPVGEPAPSLLGKREGKQSDDHWWDTLALPPETQREAQAQQQWGGPNSGNGAYQYSCQVPTKGPENCPGVVGAAGRGRGHGVSLSKQEAGKMSKSAIHTAPRQHLPGTWRFEGLTPLPIGLF